MRRFALGVAAALTAALGATAATAATYVNYGPVGADGGFTITFGNTGITDSSFTDVFDFVMGRGRIDIVITSTMSSGSQNITWTDLSFNGADFQSGQSGWNEFRFLNGFSVSETGEKHLVLSGLSGGNASYSGVLTFIPVAVPEPGAWALMILGFGGAGAALRRARRAVPTPA